MRAQVADITKRLKANENGRDTALRSSMLLSRALSYFFLEQYKEGITDIDTMLSMDTHLFEGDMFHAHMLRGVAYIQLAKYDKALSDLLIAESLQKGNVDIYLQLGAIYFQKAEYGLALENYNTAIDLDNYSAKAYAGRAVIYRKLRNEEAANLDDDKAKELGYKPEKKN